jgi:hypothetical protein
VTAQAPLGPPPEPGPATPVNITPLDFHAVAQRFVDAQNDLEHIREDLLHGLSEATGAAGACDGANQYQASWAAAMHTIINDGFSRASTLLGSIGQGIDVAARNHWTADNDSVPGQAGGPPPWSPVTPHPRPPDGEVTVLTGDAPWWMPGFLSKYIPTADTGKLDAAAQVCVTAAGKIGDLTSGLHAKLQGLVSNNRSDDLNRLEEFWQQAAGPRSILTGLPQALHDVANSLTDFRIWNNDTREAIKEKIKTVIEGLGVVGLVVAIGSALSDGILDAVIAAVVEALEGFGIDAEGALAAPIAQVSESATARLIVTGAGAVAVARGVVPAMQVSMSSTPNPNVEGADAAKISDELGSRSDALNKAYDLANNPRKLEHVIDPPKHGFADLVRQSGGRSQALRRIIDSLGEQNDLPGSGRFEVTRNIDGETVVIRGAVVDGVPRLGTAYIPAKFPGGP